MNLKYIAIAVLFWVGFYGCAFFLINNKSYTTQECVKEILEAFKSKDINISDQMILGIPVACIENGNDPQKTIDYLVAPPK